MCIQRNWRAEYKKKPRYYSKCYLASPSNQIENVNLYNGRQLVLQYKEPERFFISVRARRSLSRRYLQMRENTICPLVEVIDILIKMSRSVSHTTHAWPPTGRIWITIIYATFNCECKYSRITGEWRHTELLSIGVWKVRGEGSTKIWAQYW